MGRKFGFLMNKNFIMPSLKIDLTKFLLTQKYDYANKIIILIKLKKVLHSLEY